MENNFLNLYDDFLELKWINRLFINNKCFIYLNCLLQNNKIVLSFNLQ